MGNLREGIERTTSSDPDRRTTVRRASADRFSLTARTTIATGYRSRMADPIPPAPAPIARTDRPGRPADLTPADVRWLAWHEARCHALTSREVRDLGDAWLLHDETDREPFWNRVAGIDWPSIMLASRKRTKFLISGGLLLLCRHIRAEDEDVNPGMAGFLGTPCQMSSGQG